MIIPAGHRVMVRLKELEEVDEVFASAKKAGLEILELTSRKEETAIDQGTVVAVGATAFKDFGGENWCSVGDVIAYARHSGKRVKDPATDINYLIINDEDVVAIIKEDK